MAQKTYKFLNTGKEIEIKETLEGKTFLAEDKQVREKKKQRSPKQESCDNTNCYFALFS